MKLIITHLADYHTPNLSHKRFDGTWKVMIISLFI